MKPAPFAYYDPATVEDAIGLLADLGDDAKILAGGQSLVPMMNFRLARPPHLIDVNKIPVLQYLSIEDGALRIGAMTRQSQVERSTEIADGWPLLAEAVRYIGHVQIRNRGTVGGSLAHADPAAELPATMLALDAEMLVRRKGGERRVAAGDFFESYYTTALAPDEMLVEIRVPATPARTGWGFQEVSRRHGDFALVGAAALLILDEAGVISSARLTFNGAAPAPVRSTAAEALLLGNRPDEALFRRAGERASEDLDPDADIHATAEYRREVGAVMARRALVQAAARAVA